MISVVIWRAVVYATQPLFDEGYSPIRHWILACLISALVVPTVIWARRYLDRRPWKDLGLTPFRSGVKPLLIGMACWLVPAALGVGLCIGLGWVGIRFQATFLETGLALLRLLLLVFLYEALPEELLFRGYLLTNLKEKLTVWPATFTQAALFTLFAVAVGAAGSVDRIIFLFSFALVLGVFRNATQSLWGPIGFHLAFQAVTQLLNGIHIQVQIDGMETLQAFAFVALPFALGWAVIELISEHFPDKETTALS